MYLEATNQNGRMLKICYDLQDGTDISSVDGLEKCDIYFKRSYSIDFINSTQQIKNSELRPKILPYGLNWPCKSAFETGQFTCTLIFNLATGIYWRNPKKALKLIIRSAANAVASPAIATGRRSQLVTSEIEYEPHNPAEPVILFQTRLFDPALSKKDPDQIIRMNKVRVATMRALKEAFGDKVVGGFIPNDYTLRSHPEVHDMITTQPTSRPQYLQLVKRCLVAVFTLGILDSNGWRLPEFLATSRCIVSEPLKYELPVPLEPEKHCIYFSNPDGCVKACQRILADRSLAASMRENSFQYYYDHVRPASIVMKSLDAAMQHCGHQP